MNARIHEVIRDLKAVTDSMHNGAVTTVDLSGAAAVLDALPPALIAAATIEMPTEPGLYIGPRGVTGVLYQISKPAGDLYVARNGRKAAPTEGPFTPLVPQRAPITRDMLADLYNKAPSDGSAWQYMADELNGQDQ